MPSINTSFRDVAQRCGHSSAQNLESRLCPDHFVGLVANLNIESPFSMRCPVSQRPLHPCVLLILESPHVAEFLDEPGPAKGGTGRKIVRYLASAFSDLDVRNHGLIIMNAVQHQCSLGQLLNTRSARKVRDCVFLTVWNNGGSHDFGVRLLNTYKPNDIVMSCCTKGVGSAASSHLRAVVKKRIDEVLPGVSVLYRGHPISWPTYLTRDWST